MSLLLLLQIRRTYHGRHSTGEPTASTACIPVQRRPLAPLAQIIENNPCCAARPCRYVHGHLTAHLAWLFFFLGAPPAPCATAGSDPPIQQSVGLIRRSPHHRLSFPLLLLHLFFVPVPIRRPGAPNPRRALAAGPAQGRRRGAAQPGSEGADAGGLPLSFLLLARLLSLTGGGADAGIPCPDEYMPAGSVVAFQVQSCRVRWPP